LLYFILPFDLLPDMMGPVGRIDDLALMAYLYYRYRRRAGTEGKAQSATDEAFQESEEFVRDARGEDPFLVLEVDSDATIEQVRDAYRKRMAEYHPDKVSHLGQDLRELAHQKTLVIQNAFEKVKKLKGF
jgi:DnaJ like chaperone protein